MHIDPHPSLLDLRFDPLHGGRLQRDSVPFVFLLLEFAEYRYLCATPALGLVSLVQ